MFNREIVVYSTGNRKDAVLIYQVFTIIQIDLTKINLFHINRGNELDNHLFDDIFTPFIIQSSLNNKGTFYDNAVAEALVEFFKSGFVRKKCFLNLLSLQSSLTGYVLWYNINPIQGPHVIWQHIFIGKDIFEKMSIKVLLIQHL